VGRTDEVIPEKAAWGGLLCSPWAESGDKRKAYPKSLFQRLEQMWFHIETRRIQNAGKDF